MPQYSMNSSALTLEKFMQYMCQGTDFSECVLLVLQILRAGEDEGGAGVL